MNRYNQVSTSSLVARKLIGYDFTLAVDLVLGLRCRFEKKNFCNVNAKFAGASYDNVRQGYIAKVFQLFCLLNQITLS